MSGVLKDHCRSLAVCIHAYLLTIIIVTLLLSLEDG